MISLLFQFDHFGNVSRRQLQLFIGLNVLFFGFECSEIQNPKFLSNKIDSSNFLKRGVSHFKFHLRHGRVNFQKLIHFQKNKFEISEFFLKFFKILKRASSRNQLGRFKKQLMQ